MTFSRPAERDTSNLEAKNRKQRQQTAPQILPTNQFDVLSREYDIPDVAEAKIRVQMLQLVDCVTQTGNMEAKIRITRAAGVKP